MDVPSERQAFTQILHGLASLVGVGQRDVRIRRDPYTRGPSAPQVGAVVDAGAFTFAVEWKANAGAGAVARAAEQARMWAGQSGKPAIAMVAVPFMGQVGCAICEKAGVGWMDLSGNARVSAPGLRVIVEGKPNRFTRRGRPSSVFAPKSSRIARWLLMHPDQPTTQREIARSTGMDEGFTSRIVARLEEENLLVRSHSGAVRPRDPDLLLDAWRDAYDFSKHQVIRGHVPSGSGDVLLRQIVDALAVASVKYAVTGLAAAWVLDRFAGFRIVTVYLPEEPSPELMGRLSFREEARGSNVWLVVPNDSGILHGASEQDGIWRVHQVQVYLDLKGHPERSKEAAEQVRAKHLKWRRDGP